MTVSNDAVTVTTTATRLDTVDDLTGDGVAGEELILFNNGAVTVFVGGPDVTAATGVPVAAASWGPTFGLGAGDALYGVVASGTADVRVLETGV